MLEETTVEKKGIKLTVNFDKTDGNSYRKINEITKRAVDNYSKRQGDKSSQIPIGKRVNERKQSDSLEHQTSKSEMSTSKNEDNKALLNKHLDYLEKLKAENDNLKAKLIEERARCEFMEQEIEVENKPLGYDFNIDSSNTGFSSVASKLHTELIEFEKQISKLIESQEPIIQSITEKVNDIVKSISPKLDVYRV